MHIAEKFKANLKVRTHRKLERKLCNCLLNIYMCNYLDLFFVTGYTKSTATAIK